MQTIKIKSGQTVKDLVEDFQKDMKTVDTEMSKKIVALTDKNNKL